MNACKCWYWSWRGICQKPEGKSTEAKHRLSRMSDVSLSKLGIGQVIGLVAELIPRRSIVSRKYAGGGFGTMSGAAIHCALVVFLMKPYSSSLEKTRFMNIRFFMRITPLFGTDWSSNLDHVDLHWLDFGWGSWTKTKAENVAEFFGQGTKFQ